MTLKVTVDPGHGGSDSGALGARSQEKDVNLAIAKQVATYLTASGIQIQMTRQDDSFVSLSDRATMANNNNSDYFISVHANAGGGKGAEVFAFSSTSKGSSLAAKILNQVVSSLSLTNRGVKYANFAVLRLTAMPAILVETAFLDNVQEEAMLNDPAKQEVFGKAITDGFLEFAGLPVTQPAPPPVYFVNVNNLKTATHPDESSAVQQASALFQNSPPGTRITVVRSSDNKTLYDQTTPETPSTPPAPPPADPNPYLDMNLKSFSGVSGEDITNFIKSVRSDSPLALYGDKFVLAERNHGTNALFLMALAIHEAGWSASGDYAAWDKNIFGYHVGKPDGKFASWEEGIDKVSAAITRNYLSPGGPYYRIPTLKGMAENYSTDPEWASGIAGIMKRMRPDYSNPLPWHAPVEPDPTLVDAFVHSLTNLVNDLVRKLAGS